MKKIFSFVLCICMLIGLYVPYTAHAAESSGKILKLYYSDQYAGTWTLDDNGVLTISGNGELGGLDGFNNYEDVLKIVFNEGVESFGNGSSIANFDNMKEIEVLSSAMNGFYYDFNLCDSLEKITITSANEHMIVIDGVVYDKAVSEILLYPCGLNNKTYTVPNTVTSVSLWGGSFSLLNNYIEEVILHDKVTEVWLNCPNLEGLNIPDSVTSLRVENSTDFALHKNGLYYLGDSNNPYKFLVAHDRNIREVKISEKTKVITCSFVSPNITELVIPDNVVAVTTCIAEYCENLEKITLGKGMEEIGLICYGLMPKLKEINVSENVKLVDNTAIYIYGGQGADGTSLPAPLYNKLKRLDDDNDSGFYYLGNRSNPYVALCVSHNENDKYLKDNLVLPNGLKSVALDNAKYEEDNEIKFGASYFPNIRTVHIPKTLGYIAEGSFYGSKELTDVYYAGSKSEWDKIEICEGNENLLNANIHFGKKDAQDVTVANISAKTYGDNAFALDVTDNSTSLGALTYESSNTDVATVSADGTVTVKAAGTTNIKVSRTGNDQYADFAVTKALTVNKKAITVTAKSYTIKQGNAVPILEYDITAGTLVSGDAITGVPAVNADGTRLGEFDITKGTLAVGSNYNMTFVKGKLTVVDKTPQEIVVAPIGGKTYGDEDFAVLVTPDETANLSAFTYASSNTDVAEIAADGTITIKAVGETDITVTEPGNGEYAAFTNTQKLVVGKKSVTVTSVDLSAKTAVLEGVLSADTAVAVNFDKLKLEIIDAVDETTSNVKVTGFELTGEKAENYTVATAELNSTIANDNVVTVTATATSGTVTGAGSYIKGSSVTVTATPSSGYSFSGWYVDEASVSTSATYTFVADTDIALTAKFAANSYGGGGGGAATSTYTIKFDTNGGNEISSQSVDRGKLADEPATPKKDGYTFEGWYTDKNLTKAYDFSTKVTKNITLYAKWTEVEVPDATEKPETPAETPFSDVKENDWYYDSIKFAIENKLMNGITDTEFAPNATLTRAMLVTILYRNDGEPETMANVAFRDIASDSYYEKAVMWAKANGIVDGVTETEFAPDANITREQIATIMHRYATYKGYDVSESADILDREDYAEISDYAVSAMQYMVASGLMNGKTNTTLDPKDNATRAEIATILQRFITSNK